MEVIETDVLVVGMGPTGAMLACELSLAGIGVTVIDKLTELPAHSKEVGVPVRVVEILEQRGLLASVEARANAKLPDAHFGQLPVSLPYDGWQARHPYALGLSHLTLVEVLEDRLAERFGVRVQRGHQLTGLVQDDDGVTATVQGPAGELSIRSRYLVGCDGGTSIVRRLAEIDFPGTDGTISSVVGDVRVRRSSDSEPEQWRSVEQLLHQKRSDRAFAVLIPQPDGLHRLAGTDLENLPVDRDAPVTAEEIHDLVRKSFTDDVEIAEVLWAARFSDATRQAERYRAGRILLAGDAAHLNFPANGQGLNLGLLDAVNLGWKLAAEIHGWAPAALLDSYSAEQHPVDARLLDITKAQVEFMFPDPDKEPLRRTITALLEIPEVKRYMAGLISGLDVRYPMDGPQHPLLGARMVDVKLSVDGGVRWFSELLHDGRGALVTTDERYAEAARRWLPRITVTEVAELPEVGAQAVLVRPDGYVCWVAEENGSAEDALRRLLVALTDWFGAREPSLSSGGKMTRPTLSGLHHVTFPVTDLDGATTWFETAFEARRLPELDQHDEHGSRVAVVLRMPDVAPLVALRHTEGVPAATQVVQVGLGVADRAELTRWAAYFDGRGVAHSDIIVGPAGHVMTCTMPNGPALLLYAE